MQENSKPKLPCLSYCVSVLIFRNITPCQDRRPVQVMENGAKPALCDVLIRRADDQQGCPWAQKARLLRRSLISYERLPARASWPEQLTGQALLTPTCVSPGPNSPRLRSLHRAGLRPPDAQPLLGAVSRGGLPGLRTTAMTLQVLSWRDTGPNNGKPVPF